jgi:hypothetical protein
MTLIPNRCPGCGAANVEGSQFCRQCGVALPPSAAPGQAPTPRQPSPLRQLLAEELKRETRKASTALLIVAILQGVFGPLALQLAKSQAERQNPGMEYHIQPIGYVIVFGLAAGFFLLWIWSRFNPLPAAIVGLILFVSVHALDAVGDPSAILRGIIMKVVVIVLLIKGIAAGVQHRKLFMRAEGGT